MNATSLITAATAEPAVNLARRSASGRRHNGVPRPSGELLSDPTLPIVPASAAGTAVRHDGAWLITLLSVPHESIRVWLSARRAQPSPGTDAAAPSGDAMGTETLKPTRSDACEFSCSAATGTSAGRLPCTCRTVDTTSPWPTASSGASTTTRSEEHTSELQSRP